MGEISRRTMLQAVGAAGVGATLPTSGALADEVNTPFCPDCPDGTAAFAKYDWDGDSFEFSGGCDVVTFTDVTLDDDDEPVGAEWTSSIFYEGIHVKSSTNCDSFSREFTQLDDDEKDGMYRGAISASDLEEVKAFSYIAFCVAPCFQVDFVFGPSIENLGNDDGGFYSARKIVHLWGDTLSGHVSGTSAVTETRDGCTVHTDGIDADLSANTATVEFTHDGDPCELTLVSYVAPCPIGFTKPTGDQQSRFDFHTATVSGDGSFTVDLPTVDDVGALCEEFGGFVV